jgi:hypothetical protein
MQSGCTLVIFNAIDDTSLFYEPSGPEIAQQIIEGHSAVRTFTSD